MRFHVYLKLRLPTRGLVTEQAKLSKDGAALRRAEAVYLEALEATADKMEDACKLYGRRGGRAIELQVAH